MFNTADARVFEHLLELDSPVAAIRPQRFDGDVQTNLIAIFETVGQSLLGAVDANGHPLSMMSCGSLDFQIVANQHRCRVEDLLFMASMEAQRFGKLSRLRLVLLPGSFGQPFERADDLTMLREHLLIVCAELLAHLDGRMHLLWGEFLPLGEAGEQAQRRHGIGLLLNEVGRERRLDLFGCGRSLAAGGQNSGELFMQVMKIDREISSETQLSKVRRMPEIGEAVFVVRKTGIGSVMWKGDGEHLEMWKHALCTTSFEEASEMLKREQEKW